jgi:hypothetical protein
VNFPSPLFLLDFGPPLPLPASDSPWPLLILLEFDAPWPFLVLSALDLPWPSIVIVELDSALHENSGNGQFVTHSSVEH